MTRASAAKATALPERSIACAIAASEAAIGPDLNTHRVEAKFDAGRYVLEMRLLGVKFSVADPHSPGPDAKWRLSRDLDGVDMAEYEAVEARWAGAKWAGLPEVDRDASEADAERLTYLVYAWLEEERGLTEAYRLVGHDMAKGLIELRRINEQNRSLYAAETAAQDKDPHYKLKLTKNASRAANEGSFRYYWMLHHLWQMPITSFDDVGLKAVFAAEHGDYVDDDDPAENIRYCVIQQIAAFFEKAQARKWIDGAQKAGLNVFPWHGSINDTSNRGVMTFGQDMDGPNSFSAASDRFRRSRASRAVDGLRDGIVFDALCTQFEVEPADPALCNKVNAKLRAMDHARNKFDHQLRKGSA